jgi:hypothetical protein
MHVGDTVHAADLELPPRVRLLTDESFTVCALHAPRVEKAAAAEEGEEAEEAAAGEEAASEAAGETPKEGGEEKKAD